MRITKVFQSGHSQAVRLPKDFQLDCQEVEIFFHNGDIVLRKIPSNLSFAFELLSSMPDDFFEEKRVDLPPQKREFF